MHVFVMMYVRAVYMYINIYFNGENCCVSLTRLHRPYDFVGLTASSRQHGNVRLSKGAFKDAENLWTFGFDKATVLVR